MWQITQWSWHIFSTHLHFNVGKHDINEGGCCYHLHTYCALIYNACWAILLVTATLQITSYVLSYVKFLFLSIHHFSICLENSAGSIYSFELFPYISLPLISSFTTSHLLLLVYSLRPSFLSTPLISARLSS